jgi:hypothetical protein
MKGDKKMRHYWFEDLESGEQFLVGANNKNEAFEIAHENFGYDVECYGTVSEFAAECSGLDEY